MGRPRYVHSVLSTLEQAVAQHRTGRRWMLAGLLVGGLAGGIAGLPASWVAGRLAQASDGRLLLAEARGTVWNGDAVLVLTGGGGSRDAAALPGRLHWTLRPDWRGLRLALRQDCCTPGELPLRLSPGWGGASLAIETHGAAPTALGTWPMAALGGLGAPFNTLGLDGQLGLAAQDFRLQWVQGRLRIEGRLLAELRETRARAALLPALGNYQLTLQGAPGGGDTALLQVRTLGDAPLRVEAEGQWSGGRLRLRGLASPAAGQESALANLLSLIGRRQGSSALISIG